MLVGNIMKKRVNECFLFEIMDFYKGIYIILSYSIFDTFYKICATMNIGDS